ncbi:MAG: AraC family transcriptional regulator ligand-binding domain-containing protein [Polyangiales bacterium]|nr:AraC family transcriptional regulator ligand-binding domain-containing protein [Myxococcales bacterium]MCB9661173.1 AraC family transcriptional regulator ligand-binding domain-containing protein [Sandaracinaceae bacterium]
MNVRDISTASPLLLGVLARAVERVLPSVPSSVVEGARPSTQEGASRGPRRAPVRLVSTAGRVPVKSVHAAWRDAEARVGPDVGLIAARELHVGDIDPQGYVINAASRLGDAIDLTCRYHRLVYGNVTVSAALAPEQATLRFALVDPDGVPASLVEFAVAALYRMARFIFGDFPLTAVHFAHSSLTAAEAFQQTFRCPVRVAAESTAIVLPAGTLDLRHGAGDNGIGTILTEHLRRELGKLEARGALGPRVYALLVEELPLRGTSAVEVARELNMSERTLRRKLADEGTSHRLLLEEARREVAIRLLGEQRLAIDEVAYHLGYAQPSSFQRAFKRWTGMPPATFRTRCGRASTMPPRAPQSKTTVLLP